MNSDLKRQYILADSACGLNVKDCVKVTRIAEDFELGWKNTWDRIMDAYVGKKGYIENLTNNGAGISVYFIEEQISFYFPYFVLEKVEEGDCNE